MVIDRSTTASIPKSYTWTATRIITEIWLVVKFMLSIYDWLCRFAGLDKATTRIRCALGRHACLIVGAQSGSSTTPQAAEINAAAVIVDTDWVPSHDHFLRDNHANGVAVYVD